MQPLKDWSLKRKIAAVVLGVALFSTTSFATVALLLQSSNANSLAEGDLRVTASQLAEQVTAEAGEQEWAKVADKLASLSMVSAVKACVIEDKSGKTQASYRKSGTVGIPDPNEHQATEVKNAVEAPIFKAGSRIGRLVLFPDYQHPSFRQLLKVSQALSAAIALSVGVTLLFLLPSKRFILQPLNDFAITVDAITRSGDLGIRAKSSGGDELRRLAESINSLLAEVQRQEAARGAEQHRYQRLFRHSPEPLFVIAGQDYAIREVNDAALKTYGFSEAEFCGLNLRSLGELGCSDPGDHQAREFPTGMVIKCLHRRKDGTELMVELNSQISEFAGGKAILVQAVDITEKHRAEQALQASERRLRAVLEKLSEGLLLLDAEGSLLYANRRFRELVGRGEGELAGTNVRELIPRGPESTPGQAAEKYETDLTFEDGSKRNVLVLSSLLAGENGEAVATVISLTDLTAAKAAAAEVATSQARLIEVSRLAGMAEVATGVLHNVGNVLNSVNVSANVVMDRLRQSRITGLQKTVRLLEPHAGDLGRFFSEDPKAKLVPDYLGKLYWQLDNERYELISELAGLMRNVDHIKEIVTMQQSYAKVDGLSEAVSPAVLLEDALRLNEEALVRSRVTVEREYDGSAPKVRVDRHKVLQILVNLVTNARQAVCEAECRDRKIRVRVGRKECGRVRVEVEDNGVGIPAENLVRIFQHGFTTKKDGHGFGLHSGALAARQMGGNLAVTSAGPGLGATFSLELPAGDSDVSADSPTNPES